MCNRLGELKKKPYLCSHHKEKKDDEDNHSQPTEGARRTDVTPLFIELIRRGYDTDKTMFYYRSRNDREVVFVLRKETHIERLVQVCYDMSNPKTEKREVDALIECAGELKCNNLVVVTNDEERTIERNGYKIDVVPILQF